MEPKPLRDVLAQAMGKVEAGGISPQPQPISSQAVFEDKFKGVINEKTMIDGCPGWWKIGWVHPEKPEQIPQATQFIQKLFAQWLEGKRIMPGFLFHGPVGRGKTSAALRLAYQAAAQGRRAMYRTLERITIDFKDNWGKRDSEKSTKQLMEFFKMPDVLIVDDQGTRQPIAEERSFFFELFNSRLDLGKVTLMTTNIDLEDPAGRTMFELFFDGRILSRMKGFDVGAGKWGGDLRGRHD